MAPYATAAVRAAQRTLATTEEIDLIYRSPGMTARQKLHHIRQVLTLRLQIERRLAAAGHPPHPTYS